MLDAFSSMTIYTKYVKLPHSDDPVPAHIHDNPTVYPNFKDAVGAIDGTQPTIEKGSTHRTASSDATSVWSSCMFLVGGRVWWPMHPCTMMLM